MPRIFLTVLLLFSMPAWAIPAVPLDQDEVRLALAPFLGFYQDTSASLSFEEVSQLPPSAFQTLDGAQTNMGKNRSAWWFKVRLDNRLAQPLFGYLEINYALLDSIQVYQIEADGQVRVQRSGDSLPFAERPVPVRYFWFPLTLAEGQNTLFVRVQSKDRKSVV